MNAPLSVLIVEDSADDARLLVRHLQQAGHEVLHERVETAEALAAALERRNWDVVLSDYRLPDFDAGAALALLQESGRDIPFIVVSGAIREEAAVELMRRGANDYLMKSNLSRLAPVVLREIADAGERRERRRAETALRESEERFRAMADSAADAIVAADDDGLIRYFSRGAETVFGHAAAEALGQPVTLLIPPQHQEAHRAGMRRYLDTHESRIMGHVVELEGRRKDGSLFPIEIALSAAGVGGRTQFTAIIRDIGARKAMEAELQRRIEENERARAALREYAVQPIRQHRAVAQRGRAAVSPQAERIAVRQRHVIQCGRGLIDVDVGQAAV